MTSNKRRLYFSLFILVALLVVAYFTAKQNGWFNNGTGGDAPQSDFNIQDTTSLDKIIITKTTGERAELTRNQKGEWMINNKYRARPEGVTLIMKTVQNVKVKARVGNAARNGVIRNIASYHRKVQFFSKGQWIKTWYVGNPTSDRLGTYFLLETPEGGKSSEPYVMDMPRFHGQLDTRFFTEEEDWRFTGIFDYMPQQIKEIKVVNREKPGDGFTMRITANNKIELLDNMGGKISGFDTLTARAYTYGYRRIHFEQVAKRLNYETLDSMKKTTPLYVISVTDVHNQVNKVDLYQMKNHDKVTDLEGKVYQWNPSRLYAIMPDGEAVVVQYYSIDKLLRPASSFMRAASAPAK